MVQHLERGRQQRFGRQSEEDLGSAIFDLMFEFGGGVERGEVDDDGTGHQRAIIGGDIMRGIGQIEADPVALLHPHRLQAAGDALDLAEHLRIGEFSAHEINHDGVGMGQRAVGDHVPHR